MISRERRAGEHASATTQVEIRLRAAAPARRFPPPHVAIRVAPRHALAPPEQPAGAPAGPIRLSERGYGMAVREMEYRRLGGAGPQGVGGVPGHHDLWPAGTAGRAHNKLDLAVGAGSTSSTPPGCIRSRRVPRPAARPTHRRQLAGAPGAREAGDRDQVAGPARQPGVDPRRSARARPRQHPHRGRGAACAGCAPTHRPVSAALAGAQPAAVRPAALRSGARAQSTPIRAQLEALAELVDGARSATSACQTSSLGADGVRAHCAGGNLPRVVSVQNAYNLLNRVVQSTA